MPTPATQTCITTSYGQVRGRAKQYPYYQPALYRTRITRDGRLIWAYVQHLGTARRSVRLAESDARAYAAMRQVPYLVGIRNNNQAGAN